MALIDIESAVFDAASKAIKTAHATTSVYGNHIPVPSSFPCVTIVQVDNSVHTESSTASTTEHAADLVFEVNIYSALKSGAKKEAKSIMATVDTSLSGLMLTRLGSNPQPVPNADNRIYRIFARYGCVVDSTYRIYRR